MIVLQKSTFQWTAWSMKRFLPIFCIGSMLLLVSVFFLASPANHVDASAVQTAWIGSWATSQQLVEPANALDPADLRDLTLRQIVHLSLGGSEIRLRLSNRFGVTPLHVTAVHLATRFPSSSDKIVPASDKALTFSGSAEVTIPAHADYLSDPLSFPANALSDVAITLHLDTAPVEQTGHPGSRATSYIAHGDSVSAPELHVARTVDHWYFIAGIDVTASPGTSSVVVLGDSITDGHGSTTNANDRWTDVLSQRLQSDPCTRNLAVLNHGIGGNHLLTDGLGPNALSRFDHDVIAQAGVRYLIVLEGINDIGLLSRTGDAPSAEHEVLVRRITAAYEQMIARAHTHDIKVIGATIMPFVGSNYYHPAPANEADRQEVNEWIRIPGHFDAVIDFDKITRDPEHPDRLLLAFDSGDHLHPSPAGYAAMARAVPLSLFAPSAEPTRKIAITFDDLPPNRRHQKAISNGKYQNGNPLRISLASIRFPLEFHYHPANSEN
jgi:lysophospholipase L1-like esterase